jgi:ketosteroid isomerase-like protein
MMRQMRRPWLFLLGIFLAGTLYGETLKEALRAMTDAEKKFAQAAQEKGTRAAFLEFLAPDSIVFAPGPVNGQETWSKRPESGRDLVWQPTFAVIARSGDFGYDSGPAKWRPKKEGEFTGYGHFISIWKKQTDGSWKVALDTGIENTKSDITPPLKMVTPKDGGKGTLESLQKAQSDFVAAAKLDFTKAFRQFGGDEIRIYRNGSFPTTGKKAATELLGSEQAGVTMEVTKTDMSSSADLAYSYGICSDTRKPPPAASVFLQVWQTDKVGAWKLVLDWQQPTPAR